LNSKILPRNKTFANVAEQCRNNIRHGTIAPDSRTAKEIRQKIVENLKINKSTVDFSNEDIDKKTNQNNSTKNYKKTRSSVNNFNDILPEYFDNETVYKPMFTDYTQEEIDNKIKNLVSSKTTIDLKLRKNNPIIKQIDKMCKSLEIIFQNSQIVNIHLPIIYQGSKDCTTPNKSLNDNIKENGNYLFIYLDDRKEFLFGFLFTTVYKKLAGKFFKKFINSNPSEKTVIKKENKKSNTQNYNTIEFLEMIVENINFSTNFLFLDGVFKFDLSSYKFNIESDKLSKFFYLPQMKSYLSSNIKHLIVYDMC
jgi:hypothetical protein